MYITNQNPTRWLTRRRSVRSVRLLAQVFENIVDKIPSDFSLTKSEKEYLNSKHSLKMCIDPFWYPIEFMKDGKISGITSDLKRYFEEKIQINRNY